MATLNDMPILIVDDDDDDVLLLTEDLQEYGYTNISSCGNGNEALEILGLEKQKQLGARRISLVLLDVMLPDANGFDICTRIKKEISPFFPVILITGLNSREDHIRGVKVGADDFLSKPVYARELVAKVDLLLKRQRKMVKFMNAPTVQGREAAKPAPLPTVGDTIDDYTITKMVGWGGSAIIYKVEDVHGRPFAVKMLSRHAAEDHDIKQRFEIEIEILRDMKHPKILQVYDDGEHDDAPYFVMEYIDGDNLAQVLRDSRLVDIGFVFQVGRDVASAMTYAHSLGIVHRDLKPENIYALKAGDVKVGDFGVALRMGDVRLTQSGCCVGTPMYMAPEQFREKEPGPLTDIYSFGAMLFHLLSGYPPFVGSNAIEIARKHLYEQPPAINEQRAHCEQWNRLVVEGCLAKDPAVRPQSMDEILKALDSIPQ